jgi:hypothetical protein
VSATRSIAETITDAVAQGAYLIPHRSKIFAEVSPVSARKGSY